MWNSCDIVKGVTCSSLVCRDANSDKLCKKRTPRSTYAKSKPCPSSKHTARRWRGSEDTSFSMSTYNEEHMSGKRALQHMYTFQNKYLLWTSIFCLGLQNKAVRLLQHLTKFFTSQPTKLFNSKHHVYHLNPKQHGNSCDPARSRKFNSEISF